MWAATRTSGHMVSDLKSSSLAGPCIRAAAPTAWIISTGAKGGGSDRLATATHQTRHPQHLPFGRKEQETLATRQPEVSFDASVQEVHYSCITVALQFYYSCITVRLYLLAVRETLHRSIDSSTGFCTPQEKVYLVHVCLYTRTNDESASLRNTSKFPG